MQFRWSWRPYQQRVLEALEMHLTDRKLHVVAAARFGQDMPGIGGLQATGKTGAGAFADADDS